MIYDNVQSTDHYHKKQTYKGLFYKNDQLTVHYSTYSLILDNLMNLWAILEQDVSEIGCENRL